MIPGHRRFTSDVGKMTAKKSSADNKPTTVVADDPEALRGTLKSIGGPFPRWPDRQNALANSSKLEREQNAKQIAHAPEPAMRSPDPEREGVPVASDAKRPMSDARWTVPRSTEGK